MLRLYRYLDSGIWLLRARDLPPARRLALRLLRVAVLTLRGFYHDQCFLRAAALTFNMLLSVAPILAVVIGVAKGLGLERFIEQTLLDEFPSQETVVRHLLEITTKVLDQMRGDVVAGLGLALIIWSVVRIWMQMEDAFNTIWGVKEGRSITRCAVDYTAASILCPVLWLAGSGSAVYIGATVRDVTARVAMAEEISPLVSSALGCLPYGVFWVLLSFIYIFIPNRRIHWDAGIIAGIAAGTAYQFFQWTYITFQIGVSKYNAVYGSFAALPLFLVWLNWSWMIVLLGAELAYACQNVDVHEFEPNTRNMSHGIRMTLALWVARHVVLCFREGKKPPVAKDIARELDLPLMMAERLLEDLAGAGVLVRAAGNHGLEGYHPARPEKDLTLLYIVKSLELAGGNTAGFADSEVYRRVVERLNRFGAALEASPENAPIGDV
jgi:membrane protein